MFHAFDMLASSFNQHLLGSFRVTSQVNTLTNIIGYVDADNSRRIPRKFDF